ncbi:MAG: T9SS type A sorting domain-containing protein [Calditrichia bacterium]
MPDELTLLPAYPNPFNPETRLRFSLPKSADVTIQIFDVTGRKINTAGAASEAGAHEIRWNATNESGAAVSSGIYFYSIRANAQIKSGKLGTIAINQWRTVPMCLMLKPISRQS